MGVLAGDGRKVRLTSGWPGLGAFSLEGGFSVPEKGRCFTGGSRELGDAEGDSLGGREQKAAPRRNGRPAGEGNRCSRRMRGVGMEDTVKGVGLRELNLGFAGPVVAPCEGSQGAWLALRQRGGQEVLQRLGRLAVWVAVGSDPLSLAGKASGRTGFPGPVPLG